MKLILIGHEYKYAVEQIMLSLFPDEKPVFSPDSVTGSSDLLASSRLRFGAFYAQATTTISCNGQVFHGVARLKSDKLTTKVISDRLLQSIIKQSFFRAAKPFIPTPPVWGSLTGIRPAHIAAAAFESGKTIESVRKLLIDGYYVSPKRSEICIEAAQKSIEIKKLLKPHDIALYIGIPFCPSRCAYCSFVSNSVEKSFDMIEPFVSVLLKEIKAAGETVRALGLRVTSIYMGGGTPTALPDHFLESVMAELSLSFDLSQAHEFTIEAGRPETITESKLSILNKYGVGRVCVNPQSMSDEVLSAIGRKHTAQDVLDAVHLGRQYGFALNMDIIAGLPTDTPEHFKKTIDTVLALCPENVTIHTLSLKKGSKIMLENTIIPTGDDVGIMLDYAFARLYERGLHPYYLYRQKFTSGGFENTGWCLPGHEGIYNISMMEELCSVLSLGGGGVTKLVSANGRIERVFNAKYPREYILKSGEFDHKFGKIKTFLADEAR
ncbi:MAG: coproporphyrinogen dehydrogenase HemZ [Oscillospiraceae bacterium]|nr:coproporphyrinogen dehydrogenase HemZ [Oscillospiraceae bacterium]